MASLGLLSSLVRKPLTLSWLLSNPSLNPNSKFKIKNAHSLCQGPKGQHVPTAIISFFQNYCMSPQVQIYQKHSHVATHTRRIEQYSPQRFISGRVTAFSQTNLDLSSRSVSFLVTTIAFPVFPDDVIMAGSLPQSVLSPHNVCYKYCTFALCNKDTLVYQKNLSSTDFIVRLYFFFQLL